MLMVVVTLCALAGVASLFRFSRHIHLALSLISVFSIAPFVFSLINILCLSLLNETPDLRRWHLLSLSHVLPSWGAAWLVAKRIFSHFYHIPRFKYRPQMLGFAAALCTAYAVILETTPDPSARRRYYPLLLISLPGFAFAWHTQNKNFATNRCVYAVTFALDLATVAGLLYVYFFHSDALSVSIAWADLGDWLPPVFASLSFSLTGVQYVAVGVNTIVYLLLLLSSALEVVSYSFCIPVLLYRCCARLVLPVWEILSCLRKRSYSSSIAPHWCTLL